MNIDYGARIRAVCDYLETVPGDKYDYSFAPSIKTVENGFGCVLLHGFVGGVIPKCKLSASPLDSEDLASKWLGFCDFRYFSLLANNDGINPRGEVGKQFAIRKMRAYADTHYPNTKQQIDFIPESVRRIFEVKDLVSPEQFPRGE